MAITYKDAGVDIAAGDALVERIKPLAKSTARPEVLSGLGGFAGLFAVPGGYREPVLVSGTDGVGTKLKVALAAGVHNSIGIDLVAMAVNDIAVTGAEPLFFLDYFATSRLDVEVAASVVEGIAEGCRQSGCALLGGETAELPGVYSGGEYDLAGFAVGVVERSQLRTGDAVEVGDVLIGLPSAGLHSNGFSLARKCLFDDQGLQLGDRPELLGGATVGETMLAPTRIYVPALRAIPWFKAASHITGGGLVENPPRMLAKDSQAIALDVASWPVPPIFDLVAKSGVEAGELRRTFNMGLGMLVVVAKDDLERTLAALRDVGEDALVVGSVIEGSPAAPRVEFR